MNAPRYQIVEESQSAHCCFRYTVIDTTQADDFHPHRAICECFGREEAELIASALNALEHV